MFRAMIGMLALFWGFSAQAFSVAFINPGKSDEIYWLTASRAMEAAAHSLGIRLEVIYAERQHPRALDIAREIIARPFSARPDYVVFSNDYRTGPELLRLLDGAGIKTFLAFSGISEAADRQLTGLPRERYKGLLGSLEPHADEAGYLSAMKLIETGRKHKAQGADGRLHLLAISGDRSTPTSLMRSAGMRRAVQEAGDVVMDQEVFAAWSREKASEQSDWLFQRYPQARLVWAGSDLMAMGAIEVWESRGGKAGSDAWFSAFNTSSEAMSALKTGRLSVLAGGHFIAGAWSLVMLYDFHHGRDFAVDEGLELNQSMFMLFAPHQVEKYMERYGRMRFDRVDFRQYSKVLNPKVKRYNFRFDQLMQ